MAQEWLSIAKDIVLIGAAIVAAYVGLQGLGTWRRQLKGNNEYDLARELLKAIYELRDAIAIVRNPFIRYSQDQDPPEKVGSDASEREKRWQSIAQVYQERWEAVSKARTTVGTILLEAEVLWGRQITEKINPINQLIGQLFWAIEDYIEAINPNELYESPDREEIKKRRRILYSYGDREKDEFLASLENVIGDVEEEIKPHILRYHG